MPPKRLRTRKARTAKPASDPQRGANWTDLSSTTANARAEVRVTHSQRPRPSLRGSVGKVSCSCVGEPLHQSESKDPDNSAAAHTTRFTVMAPAVRGPKQPGVGRSQHRTAASGTHPSWVSVSLRGRSPRPTKRRSAQRAAARRRRPETRRPGLHHRSWPRPLPTPCVATGPTSPPAQAGSRLIHTRIAEAIGGRSHLWSRVTTDRTAGRNDPRAPPANHPCEAGQRPDGRPTPPFGTSLHPGR